MQLLLTSGRKSETLALVRKQLDPEERGRRIRAARIARGFATYRELSDAIGPVGPPKRRPDGTIGKPTKVAEGTISTWETGKVAPTRYLARLAAVLGVSQDYLTYADDDGPDPVADELDGLDRATAVRWARLPPDLLHAALVALAEGRALSAQKARPSQSPRSVVPAKKRPTRRPPAKL